MKRPRARPGEPPAPRRARRALGGGVVALLAAAALAAFTHRAALGAFFTTDDLILFERMRHLVAWPWTPWRLISGRLVYLVAFPAFGTDPVRWHALNLALHALNAALVAAWALRLGMRPPAALLAGGLFGASATAMTVTWSMTSIGELLACALALAGLLALGGTRVRAPLVWAAFGLGLLCKEHVVLVPLAAALAEPATARGARLRAALPVLVAGALLWTYVLLARDATGTLHGEAYAFGFGPHVLDNLRTYAAWALDRSAQLSPTGVLESVPGWTGLVGLAALLLAAFSTPAAAVGLAVFALALLPVLPLSHHTYIHYLYLPFAGWCIALGAALETIAGRWKDGLAAWTATAVVLALVTVAATLAIGRTQTAMTSDQTLLRDPYVRRMSVARNAWETLESALPADARELAIVRPLQARHAVSALTGRDIALPPGKAPAYNLIAATLDDGRGLRALFPRLQSVRFEDVLSAADTAAVLATPTPDGHLLVTGSGSRGAVALADLWIGARLFHSSADLIRSGLRLWPHDRALAWRLDSLRAHAGPGGP